MNIIVVKVFEGCVKTALIIGFPQSFLLVVSEIAAFCRNVVHAAGEQQRFLKGD